jgi:hypothetical protein
MIQAAPNPYSTGVDAPPYDAPSAACINAVEFYAATLMELPPVAAHVISQLVAAGQVRSGPPACCTYLHAAARPEHACVAACALHVFWLRARSCS